MYQGLQRKITSTEFILELGLMCDALQELSELSLELQDRNINPYQADVKVRDLVQIFEERLSVPGNHYDCAATAANNLSFEGVELHKNNKMILLSTLTHFINSLKCPSKNVFLATMTLTLLIGLIF
jgi:hypothetical protein